MENQDNQEIKEKAQNTPEPEIKEEKKAKKSNPILIILVIIALLVLVFYILFTKGIINLGNKESNTGEEISDKQEDEKQDDEIQENITAVEVYKFNGEAVDGTYKLGDKEVTIKMEQDGANFIVKLDGTEFFKTEFGSVEKHTIDSIYTMGDIIVIATTGTDIRTNNIYIYDNTGNLIKTIKNSADDDSRMKMSKYGVVDNRITFTRTMISHGPSIDNTTEIFDFSTCKDLLKENNIPEGLVVKADYEIKYLGNNKFSEEVNTKKVTIEEFVNSEDIKQHCN